MTPEDHFLPDGTEGISRYNSCHSYDLGFVHFVCINSNQDYAMFDEETEKVDDWIQRECAWLDADLTLDEANDKTKWVICYMHYAPFTVVRPAWVQRFVPIFEKHRVHLILCGHNHTNSRSIAIRSGYNGEPKTTYYDNTGQMSEAEETALGAGTISHSDDPNNGNYYIMINASGLINGSL